MGSFAQLPCCSVSVWPCWAVPVIVGGPVVTGAFMYVPYSEVCSLSIVTAPNGFVGPEL